MSGPGCIRRSNQFWLYVTEMMFRESFTETMVGRANIIFQLRSVMGTTRTVMRIANAFYKRPPQHPNEGSCRVALCYVPYVGKQSSVKTSAIIVFRLEVKIRKL